MDILSWIVFGFIVGAVARWIVPGQVPLGCIGDIVVGIIGAFIGGWIFREFGEQGVTSFWDWHSWVCAIVGAVVLLWLVRLVSGRRSPAS
ncbi:MAG: GlsB/YeaQ/YmgE family stress response membrane protein [Candidatus Tyrphobacter sp.]